MKKKPLVLLTSLLLLSACQTTRTVTLVGMTDYHSHAVPFYSEGEPGQGGVARIFGLHPKEGWFTSADLSAATAG